MPLYNLSGVTYPLSVPNGTVGAPSIGIGGAASGFWSDAANVVKMGINSTDVYKFAATQMTMISGGSPTVVGSGGIEVADATTGGASMVTRGHNSGGYGQFVAYADDTNKLGYLVTYGSAVAGTTFGVNNAASSVFGCIAQTMQVGTLSNFAVTFGSNAIARLQIDTQAEAAKTTAILVSVNSTLKRVTIGANDSGGAGFSVLRVAN